MKNKISNDLYKQILENMPICCIDMVIYHEDKILLILRNQNPEKGKWWLPGGRILKGESLIEAVKRKTKEETGLEVDIIRFLGVEEYKSKKTNFEDIKTGTHSIVNVYLVEPIGGKQEVKINKTCSDYKWINKIEENLDSHVKKALKDSGVFN